MPGADVATRDALEVLDVLAEPSRRRILEALRAGEQSVGDLVGPVGLSQPAVSKHLKVLRDAGIVAVRPDAQRRLYRIRTEPFVALDHWLEPYRALWDGRLDALEQHLDAQHTDAQHTDDTTSPRRNP